jgi:hypothetical protein
MQNRWLLTALSASILTLLTSSASDAAVFNCGSGDVACLVAAIEAANNNGQENTIRLAAGEYNLVTLGNGLALPQVTGILTVDGAGADATFVQCDSPGTFGQCGQIFNVGSSGQLTLRRLAVRKGGGETRGGGIANRGTAVLDGVSVANNNARFGGGVYNNGSLLIVNSEFRDNLADAQGGAIQNGDFDTPLGTLTIFSSLIEGNGSGGATIENFDRATLVDTVLANNRIVAFGGVLLNFGVLHVSRTAITGNRAIQAGSTVAISNGGTAVFDNATIARNTLGPTIDNGGTLTFLNSTIADNPTQGFFHTIGSFGGAVRLQNTIVARNAALDECVGSIISLGNNIIGDPAACPITILPSDLTGDPGLGLFAHGVIPLLSTSGAIDSANTTACAPLDQRGLPRVDGNGDGVAQCDIGAAEFIDHVVGIGVKSQGTINAHSHQKVTVDILGGPGIDVGAIDVATVRAGVTGHEASPTGLSTKDVNSDDAVDLRLDFRALDLGLVCDSPVIAVTAKTVGGATIAGAAEITGGQCKD